MIEQENPSVLVCVWLLGPFHVERKRADESWETIEKTAWEHTYARSLLKRLLCAYERRAMRSDLMDDLWPERSMSLAEKYLNNAASRLYKVLEHDRLFQSLGTQGRNGYELADQSYIWTDIDACEALLHEAEQLGRTSAAAFPLLERVRKHFERGGILEDEGGQWCIAVRIEKEAMMRCCCIWLAEAYEAQGMLWYARTQYRRLLEINPFDEDILCRLMATLYRHGMVSDALSYYQEANHHFRREGLSLSQTTKQLAEQLASGPLSPQFYLSLQLQAPQLHPPEQLLIQPSLPGTTRDIIRDRDIYIGAKFQESRQREPSLLSRPPMPSTELDTLDIIRSRRQVLHGILNTACTTFILSPYSFLQLENQKRLEQAILNPSQVNEEVLDDLSSITKSYWRLCADASIDLLSGLTGHFTTVVDLLKWPHSSTIYSRLCALAGENAQILGKTLYDIREYHLAQSYYTFSVKAAKEAQNGDLWAVGLGRVALLLLYNGQPQQALLSLQSTQRAKVQSARIRAWLAAVEAEIHAALLDDDACTRALDRSKNIVSSFPLQADTYATGFDASRQWGYEGACFVRLHQPGRALPVLQQALDHINSTAKRRCATLYADMSDAYAQLGSVDQACSYAQRSLDITAQIKSLSTLQRLSHVKSELEPWKGNAEVKSFNKHYIATITTIVQTEEML